MTYVDDSTEETARIFTVGGFVAGDDNWKRFDPEWSALLEDLKAKGISYFHATDCFSGSNQFKGLYSRERENILDRVLALVLAHRLRLIGFGVEEDAYKKFAPRPKRNEFGINRYVAALEGAVKSACESINTSPFGDARGDICDFYIENSEYKVTAAEAILQLRNDERIWFRHLIGNDAFGDKRGEHAIPLLKVGDFGAFLANKFLINAKDGRISWRKFYSELSDARRIWPIAKWDARSLGILRGVQGFPELTDDDF